MEALGAAGRFYRKIRDNDAAAINPGNSVRRSQAQDYLDWICFREKPPASRHRAALSAVTGMTGRRFFASFGPRAQTELIVCRQSCGRSPSNATKIGIAKSLQPRSFAPILNT